MESLSVHRGSASRGSRRGTALVLALSLHAGVFAQGGYKISGPLPLHGVEDVVGFHGSADGSRVVFWTDLTAPNGGAAVYSVPADRSQPPVRLSTGAPDYIADARFNPDGSRVVYHSDQQLFTVPADGSAAPAKLSTGSGEVLQFAIAPNGARVVYGQGTSTAMTLFSVAVADSPALQLSPPNHGVTYFRIAPDSSRVVYNAKVNSEPALYSVPVGDGPVTRLTDPFSPDPFLDGMYEFRISPDGSRVVFAARQNAGVLELFSVPIDRSQPPVRLNAPPVAGGGVVAGALGYAGFFQKGDDFAITAGVPQRVIYVADQDANDVFELYSVPIDGSQPPTRLSATPVSGGDVQFSSYEGGARFRLSADGARVVYLADQDTDEVVELYSVPVDGSQPPLKLNPPLVAGGDVSFGSVYSPPYFAVSADSSRVVYVAAQDVDEQFGLYSVPIGGGVATRLDGPLTAGRGVETSIFGTAPFRFGPGQERIVYDADAGRGVDELFSVPLDRSAPPVRLGRPAPTGANLFHPRESIHAFEVVGGGALEISDREDGTFELFRTPIDGQGSTITLNDPLLPAVAGGAVLDSWFTPDARHVLYRARGYEVGTTLFSVDLERGPARIARLSGDFLIEPFGDDPGVKDDVGFTPDGTRVLYRAQQDQAGHDELYSVPVDGSSPALRINPDLSGDGFDEVTDFQFSAGGARAAYRADSRFGGFHGLSAVPVDGSGPAVRLDAPQVLFADVSAYRTVGDDRVVFLQDADTSGAYELYRVPLEGSSAPVKLSGALVAGGSVTSMEVSSDGTWVVYRADQDLDERFELYAVRVDGSAPPVKLSGATVAGGDVAEFRLNPQGTRVVYRADQDADEVFDLYGVRIDGSAAPVRLDLSRPLADVQPDFQISFDGLGVAYRSDQDTDEVFELYVASIDGLFAPVKRSGALVTGGDVLDFQIGPGDARIVYRADQSVDEMLELYSAPVFGSSTPVRLDGPMIAGGDVQGPAGVGYRITADGSRVVYVADALTNDVFELFSVPIDASSSPKRESGPLVTGGDVLSFQLSADGKRAIYQADQDLDDGVELYLSPLVPLHEGSRSPPPGGSVERRF